MQCLKHREAAAVAICISCGAAVCPECTNRTVGQRIVCSNLCAEQLAHLLKASSEGFAGVSRSQVINAWFLWLMGAVLLLYSGYTILAWNNWDFVLYGVPLGLVSIGIGYFMNRLAKSAANRPVS